MACTSESQVATSTAPGSSRPPRWSVARLASMAACVALLSACAKGEWAEQSPSPIEQYLIILSTCTGLQVDAQALSLKMRYPLLSAVERQALDRKIACVNQIRECVEILPCLGLSQSCTFTSRDRCQDHHLQSCILLHDGRRFYDSVDCALPGSLNPVCFSDDEGARCVAGTCTDNARWCDDELLAICQDGQAQLFDCASLGQRCNDLDREAQCLPASCTSSRCVGGELAVCQDGFELERLSCAALGPEHDCTIADTPQREATCGRALRVEKECDNDASRCTRHVAEVCVGERWQRLDCASFRGATCKTSVSPIDSRSGVRCAPP